jgi:hypothetical protein
VEGAGRIVRTWVPSVGPAHGRIVGFARQATQTTFFALSIDIFCSDGATHCGRACVFSIERKSIEALKKVV